MKIPVIAVSVFFIIGLSGRGEATTLMTSAEQSPPLFGIQNFDQDFGSSGTISSSVDNTWVPASAWATASEDGFLQISASTEEAAGGPDYYSSGKATASWQDEITNTSVYAIQVNYNFLIDGFLSAVENSYGEPGHGSTSSYELAIQLNGVDYWSSSVLLESDWEWQDDESGTVIIETNTTTPVVTGEDLGGVFSGFTTYSLNNCIYSLSLATLLPGETLNLATTFSVEGEKCEHVSGSNGGVFSLTGGFNYTEVIANPEPATMLLFITGITVLAAVGRRKDSLKNANIVGDIA